ncbi:MAG: hypothetical protein KatS3mg081_2215 [Gemmatimonadales bacterium]|nr:MAG: hypothetical protein KatS3mg081_2215 [Gemmatimonadales bacterium]
MARIGALFLAMLAFFPAKAVAPVGSFALEWAPTDTKAGFAVRYKGLSSRYRVNAVSVLPGQRLSIGVAGPGTGFRLRDLEGATAVLSGGSWQWVAPGASGLYRLLVSRESPPDSIVLNVFVLVPRSRMNGEYLNGYRIGRYPPPWGRAPEIYQPPAGFIEVTPENQDTPVSPRFRLGQFLCKQAGGYPKYVVLDERLLFKLEELLDRVNAAGIAASSFHVMSGYRTPYYNHSIGNGRYSRHVWGAAADIFIDESPADGNMDDLNGDGVVDLRDADVLYRIFDQAAADPSYTYLLGGLGKYRATRTHGPFVHVDVRGFKARW